jgi:hypothetical protein
VRLMLLIRTSVSEVVYPVHLLWLLRRVVHNLITTVRRNIYIYIYGNNLPSDVAAGSSIQCDQW